jgi:hypothetical protein
VKNLEDMSFGHRVMLTVAIVIIILILLAAFGYLTGRWEAEAKVQVDCMDPIERENVRGIMLNAIDEGLKQQTIHLFETWMKDSSDQPRRAAVGANNAINAHIRARASALKWDPPVCQP